MVEKVSGNFKTTTVFVAARGFQKCHRIRRTSNTRRPTPPYVGVALSARGLLCAADSRAPFLAASQAHCPSPPASFFVPKKRSNPERRLFSETQFSNSSIPQILHYPLTSRGSFAADPPPGGAAQRLLRSVVTAIRPPRLQMRFFLITVISKQDFQVGSSEKKPWGPAARE